MFKQYNFKCYLKEDDKTYNVIALFRKFPDEEFQRVFIDKPIKDGDVKNYRVDGVNVVLIPE